MSKKKPTNRLEFKLWLIAALRKQGAEISDDIGYDLLAKHITHSGIRSNVAQACFRERFVDFLGARR